MTPTSDPTSLLLRWYFIGMHAMVLFIELCTTFFSAEIVAFSDSHVGCKLDKTAQ